MSNLPLKDLTILDMSHRLPGPMAGKLLSHLGAKVIKIEDQKFLDPFIYGLFAEMDNSFPVWYKHINKDKEVKRFDFNNPTDIEKIHQLALSADAIIMGLPLKLQQKLKVDFDSLKNNSNKAKAIVYPLASKSLGDNMHDLNALALTGLLTLHAKTHMIHDEDLTPPFLPIAGINFGNKMALDLVSCLFEASKTNSCLKIESYLYESTKEVYEAFWPEELRDHTSFLHNGLYPCYNIYKTSDNHFVVLALVEDKFWQKACEIFSWNFSMNERFETSGEIHKKLRDYFHRLTIDEVASLLGDSDICINLLKN